MKLLAVAGIAVLAGAAVATCVPGVEVGPPADPRVVVNRSIDAMGGDSTSAAAVSKELADETVSAASADRSQ